MEWCEQESCTKVKAELKDFTSLHDELDSLLTGTLNNSFINEWVGENKWYFSESLPRVLYFEMCQSDL